MTHNIYIYDWSFENDDNNTMIRCFGIDKNNQSVMLTIDDFSPYFYIELPSKVKWNGTLVKDLIQDFKKSLFGGIDPTSVKITKRKKLYYANNNEVSKFLLFRFPTNQNFRSVAYKLKSPYLFNGKRYMFKVHEFNATPILQLCSVKGIPTSGWVSFTGVEVSKYNKVSECEKEYDVSYLDLNPYQCETIPSPTVLSFDIEVYSSNPNVMPNATKPVDCIFQISSVFFCGDKQWNYLITLGDPPDTNINDNIIVVRCSNEAKLIKEFCNLILEHNPQFITGYNIFGFDLPYLMDRAKLNHRLPSLLKCGMLKGTECKEKNNVWSSSAYGKQEFRYIDYDGRVVVDLLKYVQREQKLPNYRLETVSNTFLGDHKDPLTHKDIFRAYETGVLEKSADGQKLLAECGNYCVQDSILVQKLFDRFEIFLALTETAKVCSIPPSSVYTQGQQIRCFSQIYRFCYENKIVVENDAYKPTGNEQFQGATVLEPEPGIYENVVPFDFSSLYPTIIIAYNIDYSTLVKDGDDIPDEQCNIVEWGLHEGCIHSMEPDPLGKTVHCEDFRFRFLKNPKGVVPTIIENLLDIRAKTRKKIKELKKTITPENKKEVGITVGILNQRQLSYKVSANSFYGAMGALKGYLPFMAGAMSITALGRYNLQKAAKYLQSKYDASLIYGDSVTGDTPVCCLFEDEIRYFCIDEISQGDWKIYEHTKEISTPLPNIQVWTEKGFTSIKKIIRHKTDKQLFRITTHTGCIDVTEDHSLLDINAEKICPNDINIGTDLLHSRPKNIEIEQNITSEEAYVWGLFFADGSCGVYNCPSGKKRSWAINKSKYSLLQNCMEKLEFVEKDCHFKILDTMNSSHTYRLVPYGNIKDLVDKYRKLFYDNRKFKRIPKPVLNGSRKIKESFFQGYYDVSGDKILGNRFDCKGKISSAELFYLCQSLGYNVSINTRKDKPDIFRMTFSKNSFRENPNQVKKIEKLSKTENFVYDLETDNHHFAAGVGNIIAHNTDSCYMRFPHIPPEQLWDHATKIEKEMHDDKIFPEPMLLEFENAVYDPFLILTKKRYVWKTYQQDGTHSKEIGKKGVILARRDNSAWIRDVYKTVIEMMFDKISKEDIFYFIIDQFNKACSGGIDKSQFIITKRIGDVQDYKIRSIPSDVKKANKRLADLNIRFVFQNPDEISIVNNFLDAKIFDRQDELVEVAKEYHIRCLGAHIQLAEKMRNRGIRVDVGQRLEFIITEAGGPTAKNFDKIEDPSYIEQYKDYVKIDPLYYIRLLSGQLDDLIYTVFKVKNFTKLQLKLRSMKYNVHKELRTLFRPNIMLRTKPKIRFI